MEGDLAAFGVSPAPVWNFNPLPPHGGRPHSVHLRLSSDNISIHSLRMEGDPHRKSPPDIQLNFNPLPPHGGRLFCGNCGHQMKHFNPLPPHGGRQHCVVLDCRFMAFQSTPSAWRETVQHEDGTSEYVEFQSTPSAWRETYVNWSFSCSGNISIHSLRMEGD